MNHSLQTSIVAAALLTMTSLNAQEKTKEGYALSWNNEITIVPDSLENGNFKLPAYSFTLFETDGGNALDLWKSAMKTKAADVGGSKPMKASGAMLPAISPSPLLLMAVSSSDKKANTAKLTVAYALNDSTPVPEMNAAMENARAMAVQLNKAVVEEQIESYSKTLDKATNKSEGAQEAVEKNDKAVAKANKDIAKAKTSISKVQASNAELSGNIAGLEKRFALSNDPKDLKSLTKAREKLAKSEGKLADHMKSEAKAQETLNKYEGKSPDQAKEAAERAELQKKAESNINALRQKMEMIK
ncbi:MAG: hypothetical protein KA408_06935 [Flavobacteriales bacterium]|jgi:hypothetical protein|nr:hypothetical protein [Flavobacteriales bacterium]